MPLHTPFYDYHLQAGAKMVEYAGWEMPLLYRGITQEHLHTREKASLFDISHMGRIRFGGRDAVALLDKTVTRRIADQSVGVSRYSLVCNQAGGVLDDVIVSRDKSDWLVVCNAANRLKLLAHFNAVATAAGMEVTIDDQTERTAMLALQGPLAIERIADALPFDVTAMKRYTFETATVVFIPLTIFRSGYTGEDGVELILPARAASMAMKMMGGKLNRADATLQPAGLGARDTLRLEAAMPLYGHELSEDLDPLAAGLAWAVDLNKDFIGRSALAAISAAGIKRKLIGLELEGRRIARQGSSVQHNGTNVGQVTSGTFSPTLQRSIAMAYVDAASAAEGTRLAADCSGSPIPATVVKLPFYKRTRPGS
jgi:aminomethyltransferase